MHPLLKIIAYFISLPARAKGMEFGRNSFIGPGYDWLFVQLSRIKIGDEVLIGKNAWLQTDKKNGQIVIGNNTHVGRRITISAIKNISIGKHCLLSYDVSILDHDHEFNKLNFSPEKQKLTRGKEIAIDDHCFIGAHSFILKGVHLGHHCIVGAGSVVTKSFPPYSIVAGIPAKLLKRLKTI